MPSASQPRPHSPAPPPLLPLSPPPGARELAPGDTSPSRCACSVASRPPTSTTSSPRSSACLVVAHDFRTLFRHFDRRIAILRDLYGDPETDPGSYSDPSARFHDLDARCDEISIRPSLRAVRWERHSLERDERHPMKGLLGTVALSGDLAPFVPTLRLAELVHVGKMTSHGLGRLRVELG